MIEAVRNSLNVCEVSAVFLDNPRRASFVRVSAIWEFLVNLVYYRLRLFRDRR